MPKTRQSLRDEREKTSEVTGSPSLNPIKIGGLEKEPDDTQVNALLFSMGNHAENVLLSAGISEFDEKDYDKVITKLDQYFLPMVNVVYETATFNLRKQGNQESADQFINDLHRLAERCNYEILKDGLIRDKIVVGINDQALSEELQLMNNLTLDDAVRKVKNVELVKQQQSLLAQANGAGSCDEIRK